MKTKTKYRIILTALILFFTASLFAAEDIYIEFTTIKKENLNRYLIAKLTAENDNGEYFVVGQKVKFFAANGDNEIIMGVAISNEKGIAELNLHYEGNMMPKDDDDYITFFARIEPNDKYELVEEQLQVKDVEVKLDFIEVEGEKQIHFAAAIIDKNNNFIPIADDDLYLYVPRMFSQMKIADGWLEENGKGYVEFPLEIIGDENGNITVIAKIEEHDDFGNIEVSKKINWASPKTSHLQDGPLRELWTPIAPVWMIITLIILLAGVWGHYIYAGIQLWKIKKSSK